jgi:transcriptional regulator with XRE-family HTH domain
MKAVTKRLRVIRAERNLTQMKVAFRAKIHINHYWRIENGWTHPSPDEQERIAKVFDLPVSDVFPTKSESASGESEPAEVAR